MTTDKNKGMSVEYNILNLPRIVKISNAVVDNGSINYRYSTDGVKRKVTHCWREKLISSPKQA